VVFVVGPEKRNSVIDRGIEIFIRQIGSSQLPWINENVVASDRGKSVEQQSHPQSESKTFHVHYRCCFHFLVVAVVVVISFGFQRLVMHGILCKERVSIPCFLIQESRIYNNTVQFNSVQFKFNSIKFSSVQFGVQYNQLSPRSKQIRW